MTCVVGYKYAGKVWLAGDQVGGNNYFRENHTNLSKVFQVKDFILGYTTSFRMGQILQYSWNPPVKQEGQDDDTYLYRDVVNSLSGVFDSCEFGSKEGVEKRTGQFLLGWKGRLFTVQSNLSILEHDEFAACGCGEDFARGAMHIMSTLTEIWKRPEDFLKNAILAAARYSPSVGNTVTFVEK